MKSAYLSHRGNVREINEDSVYAGEFADNAYLALVADGMGGYNAGEIASEMAIATVKETITSLNCEGLEHGFHEANSAVYNVAIKNPDYRNMGTTLTGCLIKDGSVYIANVGDSRIYLISDQKIRQLTVDHSYVQELVDMGHITKNEAAKHPNKNIITRAIGTDANVKVDTFLYPVNSSDTVLLCSDGLSNLLSDEEILGVILKYKKMETCVKSMMNTALARGGHDNITVIAIKV